MLKYFCNETGCDHSAEAKGFCPKHGKELVEKEVKGTDDAALQAILGKIGEVVKAETEKTIKEMGLSADTKAIHGNSKIPANRKEVYEYVKGILSDGDAAELQAKSTVEKQDQFLGKARVAYFFKSLIKYQTTKDPEHLQVVKALAVGVDADGGYLTPTEFRAQLVEDQQQLGFLRQYVTVIPMTSNSMEVPTLLSSVKTSWGSENTAISTTTARFGTLTFAPKRLNTMIYTSRELANDSALGIVQLLTRLIREAIGREEDRVIVAGSGTGQPKGILQETLGGIDNGNDDSTLAANVKKLPFLLAPAYRARARWIMNSISTSVISTLRDTAGQFLYSEGIEGQFPQRLAGLPVSEEPDVPLDTLILGDLTQYFLADREQISVETTTEGAGTFEKHQVAIKVIERIDGKVAQTNAFKTLTNAGID